MSFLPIPKKGKGVCLYDLRDDPGEHRNVAKKNPDVVAELWTALNMTILTVRDCNGWSYGKGTPGTIPGPGGSCSPAALLGHCDKKCAEKKWDAYGAGPGAKSLSGPMCGVPGCS